MLTTAKSIQLLDASGLNISPITDITSLYYEAEEKPYGIDSSVIVRKYVYSNFPIGVNIDPSVETSIGVGEEILNENINGLYNNGILYEISDSSGNDIVVADVSTHVIPGTTYRQIDVKRYNLSKILSNYTPVSLMNSSFNDVSVQISNINSSISDVSNRVYDIYNSINADSSTFNKLLQLANDNQLWSNKFYLVTDYYVGNGCMYIPNNTYFGGPTIDSSIKVLIKACNSNTFDNKIYGMYLNNGTSLNVHGTYEIKDQNKLKVTWLKDNRGNEAAYDFYNLIFKIDNRSYYTFSRGSESSGSVISYKNVLTGNQNDCSIYNNVIKTDPFISNKSVVFCNNSSSQDNDYFYVMNNNIDYENEIFLNADYGLCIINNRVNSDNNIKMISDDRDILTLQNCIIANNNEILNFNQRCLIYNANINSNNKIKINGRGSSATFTNLSVCSSNNISLLYRSATTYDNIVILNNCNASINCNVTVNLLSNIVIDNCSLSDDSSLTPTSNSVYIFGQDVYAKSFNTLN